MRTVVTNFEIDGYKINAFGTYEETDETLYDVDFVIENEDEVMAMDDKMLEIIMSTSTDLLFNQMQYGELEF